MRLLPAAAAFAALFALMSGCVTIPIEPQDCSALAAAPSRNAPLIPALQGDPEELLDALLAAIGDPAVAAPASSWRGDLKTLEAETLHGATARLVLRAGAFHGFWYERQGHAAAYDAAAAARLLEPVLDRLRLDAPVEQAGPEVRGHHGEESAHATSALYLAGRPVARPQEFLTRPYDWDLPLGATASLDSDPSRLAPPADRLNATTFRVDPLVQLPDPAALLPDDALAAKGEAWVACRIAGTWLDGPVEGWTDPDAWFVVEGSIAAAVQVEYGGACPPGAWNRGDRYQATVLVDAVTGAVLDVEEGRWNCIAVPDPGAAVLPPR